MFKQLTYCLTFLLTFYTTLLYSTTIAPFENLGEMARNTELVVMVKVLDKFERDFEGTTKFFDKVEIINVIKGNRTIGETLLIQSYHTKIGDVERIVWGDLEVEKDKEYLLFLANKEGNIWQPTMLSYGALEKQNFESVEILIPMGMGLESHHHTPPGQEQAEALGIYNYDRLINHLKEVVSYKSEWSKEIATSRFSKAEVFNSRMLPSHCTTLSGGGDYARWVDIETTALPIYYHVGSDPDCTNTVNQIDNAISNINTNYQGLSLVNQGTHNFNPTCNGGQGANGSEFTNYMNNTIGTGRAMLIQFDDPCSEIPDLSGCNGTLAFGGLYWSSATYSFNSMDWRLALYGYVVVNNGTGACQCPSTDYEIMMTHEITHTLNIGHISTGSGVANMNPSCCNSISALDEECLDFIYASPLPVDLNSYDVKLTNETAVLNWSTYSEINNDYFTIERKSESGEFEFFENVKSKGNNEIFKSYRIIDENPLVGTSYYRLSQKDVDGTTQFLGTKSIRYFKDFNVYIHPNPIQNQRLNLEVMTNSEDKVTIEIYQSSGRLISKKVVVPKRGVDLFDLVLPNQSLGLLMARITQGDQVKVVKFVSQ